MAALLHVINENMNNNATNSTNWGMELLIINHTHEVANKTIPATASHVNTLIKLRHTPAVDTVSTVNCATKQSYF